MKKIIQFVKECYVELKKVVWPTRKEVATLTKVVLISVVVFAIFFGVLDYVLLLGSDLVF